MDESRTVHPLDRDMVMSPPVTPSVPSPSTRSYPITFTITTSPLLSSIVTRGCIITLSLWLLLLLLPCVSSTAAITDPYKVLGVPKTATISEIRSNYRELARKWHPDKNMDDPSDSASDQFLQITAAYQLLSDPERRDEFDKFGTTMDTPNFRTKHDYTGFKRFDFDPFESLFNSGGDAPHHPTSSNGNKFNFQFTGDQGSLYRKQTVTTKQYENRMVLESNHRPHLILFYGDLCFPCIQAEPIWQRLVTELEPLGVIFATVHSQHEAALARKVGVTSLPYVIGLADGVVKHYKDPQLNLVKTIEFLRRLLPRHLVPSLDDSSYKDFLNQWPDNRVRVIVANSDKQVRLRYLLTAFRFKDRVAMGHIPIGDPFKNTTQFMARFDVDPKKDSMLVFNEDTTTPVTSLAADDLKINIMHDVLEGNKFLLLPRLSSQVLFDQLCPSESVRMRRLCVVLVTNNIPYHDIHREAMRSFIREIYTKEGSTPKVRTRDRFMYLLQEKQPEFVKDVGNGLTSPDDPALHVLVIWRRESNRIMYEWLPDLWNPEDAMAFNSTKFELKELMNRLSKNLETFPNDVRVRSLIDEEASGFIGKMVKRFMTLTDGMTDNITQKEILPVVSVILSLGFILLIGYIMQYLFKMEEESIQERYRRLGRAPPGAPIPKPEPKLNVHELRGETYNGLIRLLKPGCRTLVLVCDRESKAKLLPKFYRSVYPYRKNKTLMFAFLLIEKNLDWYKKILQQTLADERELNINPKNCIGTVICLNGFRKYFCVYHAKHPELKVPPQKAPRRQRESTETGSSFLAFDEADSDNDDVEAGNLIRRDLTPEEEVLTNILFEEHLLDGLSLWLDRLFDGTTQKYHIQYWPEQMK